MKIRKSILYGAIILFLSSCASTAKFPVSDITPAAVIKATKKKSKNNNYKIKLTAKYLASPDRIIPPKNVYVAWVITAENGIKNIGRLNNKNAKTVELNALTPFNVFEIFITAEKEGNITYPTGVEISRTTFKKW